MTTITIREQSNNTQNKYFASVSFNKDEFPSIINNPCTNKQVIDLEWYFSKYPSDPDDEDRAKSIAASIKKCGIQLFDQVFKSDYELYARYREAQKQIIHGKELLIEIIGSPAFHGLPWETLNNSQTSQPLALYIPIVRQYTSKTKVALRQSPIINLLIVTARPARENDIDYRAISRPLVDRLRQAKLRVNMRWLRVFIWYKIPLNLSRYKQSA